MQIFEREKSTESIKYFIMYTDILQGILQNIIYIIYLYGIP